VLFAIARARAQEAEADAMGDRLRNLSRDLAPSGGVMLAAQLRSAASLARELESEAEKVAERADHARIEGARLRGLVVTHERRRDAAESAAALARAREMEDRAARIEAQTPAPRRR
jgi:hypothetical protein